MMRRIELFNAAVANMTEQHAAFARYCRANTHLVDNRDEETIRTISEDLRVLSDAVAQLVTIDRVTQDTAYLISTQLRALTDWGLRNADATALKLLESVTEASGHLLAFAWEKISGPMITDSVLGSDTPERRVSDDPFGTEPLVIKRMRARA
jgi:hypothetical protein